MDLDGIRAARKRYYKRLADKSARLKGVKWCY